MEYQIEEIKKMVKEDLTDAEAKDLLQKMEKSREAEMAGKPYMTFDWAKAIMLIFAYDIQNAEFGLREDWEESKAIGLHNQKPIPPTKQSKFGYCLTSNWATPVLYDIDNNQYHECYKKIDQQLVTQGLWWPEDVHVSFNFVKEIMEDLQ